MTGIHRNGHNYIYTTLIAALCTQLFVGFYPALPLWLLSFGLIWFFRNPERKIVEYSDNTILSPADGQVLKIVQNAKAPDGYEDILQAWTQISIFMRVYDVHVNRAPIAGGVIRKIYTPGQFKYAAAKQADTDNERLSIMIAGDKFNVICQQVAGMLARRIICDVEPGDRVDIGDVYGLIQVGSRLDLWIPSNLPIEVKEGQIVKAGLTIIVK